MTSSERPTLLTRAALAAIWVLLGAVVAGVAIRYVFMIKSAPMMVDPDDRPPIIVSNGSVRVEEADHRRVGPRPGKFTNAGTANAKTTWRHDHPGPATKRMEVVISGVNPGGSSNCGTQADFYARSVDSIQISYSVLGSTLTREMTVKIAGSHIEFVVDEAAVATQTAGQEYAVDFDGVGVKLQTATLELPGGAPSAACTFGATTPDGTPISPRITILQRQKP